MRSISGRRITTPCPTFHVLSALTIATGLSVAPFTEARAQHAGHHGHQEPARKPKAPARGAEARHGGHGASGSDTPAVSEFKAAHASMMRGMDEPYTGDPDVDFRIQMIPHHQGAIDMARVALRRAVDPWTRQLAEALIYEQQREIAEMQGWLARRGVAAPAGGQPRHVLGAGSFRSVPKEPGTRDELLGQSWAPGSGVPASR